MHTYHEFASRDEAIQYRRDTGCGGLIFSTSNGGAILFPLGMTPTPTLTHPLTAGQSGQLV